MNLIDVANGRPSRTNFLQIKNAMEQYMIGISEDDVNAGAVEDGLVPVSKFYIKTFLHLPL